MELIMKKLITILLMTLISTAYSAYDKDAFQTQVTALTGSWGVASQNTLDTALTNATTDAEKIEIAKIMANKFKGNAAYIAGYVAQKIDPNQAGALAAAFNGIDGLTTDQKKAVGTAIAVVHPGNETAIAAALPGVSAEELAAAVSESATTGQSAAIITDYVNNLNTSPTNP